MQLDWKNSKWILLPACLVLGLALLITFVSISQDYLSEYLVRNSKDHIGQKLDPLKLADFLEEPLLKAQPGTPSLLVFWSVTCAPCIEKLKDLQDLGREGRNVFAINTDETSSLELAQKIFSNHLPEARFFHDKQKILQTQLGIDYLPTYVYLSNDGTIEKITIGKK